MAGIYIHIPFCKQACHYCDFHFSTSLKYKDEMLQSIIKEIGLQQNYLGSQTIETVYFGGGTPSLLTGDEVSRIIEAIQTQYDLSKMPEVTLEANPDDLNLQKLREFRNTSINRFSIGVQSFFDEDLKWMNRAHQANEAESAIKRAQDFGFENITIDLIYGYPLLTDQKWEQNIQKAIQFQIPHISSYSMTVEPKTALANFINTEKQKPLDDAQSAAQFQILMAELAANGFQHYEISNFAKPNQFSKHNTNYWKGVHYLGIGPSAHSFNGESRQWNIANNAKYLAELATKKIPFEMETLSLNDRFNEYIMTSLRTMWGIDLRKVNHDFDSQIKDKLLAAADEYLSKNWLAYADEKLILTQEGKLYADLIASELFITENEF
ncbi:radical SAM family heme chaperone HemW [Pedobacter cryophilus]|uniref:Heme chaperone HemW n=1 Tax=Pedobacter cryophilus TaxID=2571271 RepID=A0A4U1C319_9SPHI|nr:radical SAM family heme chaperone HemW [Pedobacter cryophilus]TKC00216.1 radical SAM family heme chaperone HemW [Pedobacter cryophilus]